MGIFDFIFGRKSRKSEKATVEVMPTPIPKPESKPAPTPAPTPRPQTRPAAPSVPKPKAKPNNAPITYVPPVASTQQDVLDYLSKNPKGITFVHGKAGCGKTYLINQIESSNRGCQVLTPTNLAASLYNRARTLHSFFWKGFDKLEEGFQNPDNITSLKASAMASELSGVSMLVFDEISMVRSDTFEMMNQICQRAKGNSLPFGGIPVVVVGDLFQLPPVVSDGRNSWCRESTWATISSICSAPPCALATGTILIRKSWSKLRAEMTLVREPMSIPTKSVDR